MISIQTLNFILSTKIIDCGLSTVDYGLWGFWHKNWKDEYATIATLIQYHHEIFSGLILRNFVLDPTSLCLTSRYFFLLRNAVNFSR